MSNSGQLYKCPVCLLVAEKSYWFPDRFDYPRCVQCVSPVYKFLLDPFCDGATIPRGATVLPQIDVIRIDVETEQDGDTSDYSIWVRSGAYVSMSNSLCKDELLGAIAHLLFYPGCSSVPVGEWESVIPRTRQTFYMEAVGSFHDDWNIRFEDRFSGMLTRHEALGSVASFLFTGKWMFGGLRSYIEHVKGRSFLREKPVALIGHQRLQNVKGNA